MAFDLDDDELKATRRMNGSDKNVGSMKEDIKLVGNLIKEYRLYGDLDGIAINDMSAYINAIEHLIKAYKELEEENKRLKPKIDVCNWQEKSCREIIDEKYVPVSLVKENLEELEKQYKFYNSDKRETKNIAKGYYIAIQKLKELLEGK